MGGSGLTRRYMSENASFRESGRNGMGSRRRMREPMLRVPALTRAAIRTPETAMPPRRFPLPTRLALLGLLVSATAAPAQTTPAPETGTAPRPAPVESAPLPPPPAAATPAEPAPGTSATPVPAPSPPALPAPPAAAQPATPPAPPAAQPAPGTRQTLVPTPGDPNDVDEVTLPARPAAILSGRSTWDEGFAQLKGTFARIEAALKPLGVTPTGRPVAVFVETDDMGFRYEAMIPVDRMIAGPPAALPELRAGMTPSGKALRFVHESPYDDIDTTYETITAYLDAKGVTVNDTFIEEYVGDLTEASDPNLRINIFVQPK